MCKAKIDAFLHEIVFLTIRFTLIIWWQGVATNVGACHRCFQQLCAQNVFMAWKIIAISRDFISETKPKMQIVLIKSWEIKQHADFPVQLHEFCHLYEIGSKSISQQRHVELFADSKCFHLHLDPCYSIFIVNVLIETVANISLVEQKWRQMTYLCWRAIGWHMANPADSGEQRR